MVWLILLFFNNTPSARQGSSVARGGYLNKQTTKVVEFSQQLLYKSFVVYLLNGQIHRLVHASEATIQSNPEAGSRSTRGY
jgi:hypothetical protein